MARRLFKRMILMFSVLTMLVIPTGQASGQGDPLHDGEMEGTVTASNVVSPCPDPNAPATHCRDEGLFAGASLNVVARRPEEGRRHEVHCAADQGGNVTFRARQDAAQGRGFIGPSTHIPAPGELFRDENDDGIYTPDEVTLVTCRLTVDQGVFHRVGTVAYGSIRVGVHVDGGPTEPFRHHYCARFVATAIPTGAGPTIVTAVARGRVDACGGPPDPLHQEGRTAADDPTGEHG